MFRQPLFSDIFALHNAVDRLASQYFGDDQYRTQWSRSGNGNTSVQPMPLDVYATEEQAVILAAIPGMQPDDLDLAIHENTVTLSGTVQSTATTEETKGATWYAHELWSGDVRRSVTLPFQVDADRAQAVFEHGILRVVLPKAASAKPRKISIASGAGQQAAIEARTTDTAES